jgi:hypothetical protein
MDDRENEEYEEYNDEGYDDEDEYEKTKKVRKVKYQQHGILKKEFYYRKGDRNIGEKYWVFEGSNGTNEYIGDEFDLIGILDDLSKEGYELVCGGNDEYILRTKNEIEETEEYWDDVDFSS